MNSTTPPAVALADDLTGAIEAGAILAAMGLHTLVTLDTAHPAIPGVLVIDTESRHSDPEAARDLHRDIAARWHGPVFKKTDSTLRGNIGAEFTGLIEATRRPLVYIPAYPRIGRTVANGILHVDGVPLSQTVFARDPRNPMLESSVRRVLERDCPYPVDIHDAASEEDMAAIARSLDPSAIIASPAGFISHWASRLALPRKDKPILPTVNSFLLACGSLHPRSREQAAEASRLGWDVVCTSGQSTGSPEQAAARLAESVAARLPAGALVVFGGDTARAILNRLGCSTVEPLGEVAPGVPVSRITVSGSSIALITKAGGFGEPGLAHRIRATLEKK